MAYHHNVAVAVAVVARSHEALVAVAVGPAGAAAGTSASGAAPCTGPVIVADCVTKAAVEPDHHCNPTAEAHDPRLAGRVRAQADHGSEGADGVRPPGIQKEILGLFVIGNVIYCRDHIIL